MAGQRMPLAWALAAVLAADLRDPARLNKRRRRYESEQHRRYADDRRPPTPAVAARALIRAMRELDGKRVRSMETTLWKLRRQTREQL